MNDALIPVDFEYDGSRYLSATAAYLASCGVPDSAILDAVKRDLLRRIDAAAEAVRSRYITAGVGQALEYQQASAEAAKALSGAPEDATAARFPMLAASIGVDTDPSTGELAADVIGVARSVAAAGAQWLAVGAAIRTIRLRAKAAIEAAPDAEAARAAFAAVEWPSA